MKERGGRRKRPERREEDPKEHSSRYDKYKADLNRLFDQGMAGELLKKVGRDALGKATPANKGKETTLRRKGEGRIPANRAASSGRLKILRAVLDADDRAALTTAIDDLAREFGLPDDWEVLGRVLEHPDENLVFQAVSKMANLLSGTARISRRATLKERLRAISQTAANHDLRDLAGDLEQRL